MSDWYYGTERDLEILQHYGVLGMKWGVRKSSGSGAKSRSRKRSKPLSKEERKELKAQKRERRRQKYIRAKMAYNAASALYTTHQINKSLDKLNGTKEYPKDTIKVGNKYVPVTNREVLKSKAIATAFGSVPTAILAYDIYKDHKKDKSKNESSSNKPRRKKRR